MGNLTHYAGSGSGAHPNNPASPGETLLDRGAAADGYASEDFVPGTSSSSSCRERKKGLEIVLIWYDLASVFFIALEVKA